MAFSTYNAVQLSSLTASKAAFNRQACAEYIPYLGPEIVFPASELKRREEFCPYTFLLLLVPSQSLTMDKRNVVHHSSRPALRPNTKLSLCASVIPYLTTLMHQNQPALQQCVSMCLPVAFQCNPQSFWRGQPSQIPSLLLNPLPPPSSFKEPTPY